MQTQARRPSSRPHTPRRLYGLPRREREAWAGRVAELEPTWERLEAGCSDYLTDFLVLAWVHPCRMIDADESCVWLAAPTYIAGWLRERYLPVVETVACKLAQKSMSVRVIAFADLPIVLARIVEAER